jgi:tetratricopeptide (TPR) repeat protein
MDLPTLRDILSTYFNVDELRNLCFDLNILYEDLGGEGKSGKARELVAYCQRRDRLAELEAACRRLRPNAFQSNQADAAALATASTAPEKDKPSAGSGSSQSGGINIEHVEHLTVQGDMVGRDKIAAGSTPAISGNEPSQPPPPPSDLRDAPSRPDDSFEYDVFISHSRDDDAWVTGALLPALENARLGVCIDDRDFVAGKPALINMQEASKHSRHTLLVLTPAWLNSEWTLFESLLIRTSDPAGLQRRTIPLILKKCDIPEFISVITWVDFTRPDRYDIAWRQLLTALGAAPLQVAPAEETPPAWNLVHPYGMPPNFTGRVDEKAMLTQWLNTDIQHPLLVIRALGGFGKSALAWHWLTHDVDAAQWPRVVWWSFYEGDASFEHFLSETLSYLKIDPASLGPRQQVDALLQMLQRPGTLLILDGFERALRAFSGMNGAYQGDLPLPTQGDHGPRSEAERGERGEGAGMGDSERDCLSPFAEHFLRSIASLPNLHGKVLMTTRLCPRILQAHGGQLLQGCLEKELLQMQPADAVAFFRAQGVRGARAEIEAACSPYGYHPLSLRLLAGLILGDLRQPGDIAVAKRLDVSGDQIQRQHHVLQQAYDSLTPARQNLLSRIACFRSAVSYEALQALSKAPEHPERSETQSKDARSKKSGRGSQQKGTDPHPSAPLRSAQDASSFDADLHDLLARGLLHRDEKTNRFDLHPIVRRYAYDRLTASDRIAAHAQLRDYFTAVPTPSKVQTLDDLRPVIELYHHTVRAGQYDEAHTLFRDRINEATYYQFGAYQLRIELLRALFPDGKDRPPRLKTKRSQSWAANALANSYGLSGQPSRAVTLFLVSARLDESEGDKKNLAIDLGNVALVQVRTGALKAAEANLRRRIDLCREIKDEFDEAIGHQELGWLLAYRGVWEESEEELATSTRYWDKTNDVQGLCLDWAYRALRALLMVRTSKTSPPAPLLEGEGSALFAARHAMELADETACTRIPVERDYMDAHWLLGAAERLNGNLAESERHLSEALTRCRNINAVEIEANILLDLARLRVDQNDRDEAVRLAQEALLITERSGYVLQGADVHLFLAQMALKDSNRTEALQHARETRRLATCNGPPDYTYKVAYDEAGALLAELGET